MGGLGGGPMGAAGDLGGDPMGAVGVLGGGPIDGGQWGGVAVGGGHSPQISISNFREYCTHRTSFYLFVSYI